MDRRDKDSWDRRTAGWVYLYRSISGQGSKKLPWAEINQTLVTVPLYISLRLRLIIPPFPITERYRKGSPDGSPSRLLFRAAKGTDIPVPVQCRDLVFTDTLFPDKHSNPLVLDIGRAFICRSECFKWYRETFYLGRDGHFLGDAFGKINYERATWTDQTDGPCTICYSPRLSHLFPCVSVATHVSQPATHIPPRTQSNVTTTSQSEQ